MGRDPPIFTCEVYMDLGMIMQDGGNIRGKFTFALKLQLLDGASRPRGCVLIVIIIGVIFAL